MNRYLLTGTFGPPPAGTIQNSLLENSSLNMFQSIGPGGSSKFIEVFVPKFVGLLYVFGGLSFFFMLLWGAVSWILSGGDKASLEGAKNKITNAFVGLILLIGSFAIIKLIEGFFNINILLIDIGPLVIQ